MCSKACAGGSINIFHLFGLKSTDKLDIHTVTKVAQREKLEKNIKKLGNKKQNKKAITELYTKTSCCETFRAADDTCGELILV